MFARRRERRELEGEEEEKEECYWGETRGKADDSGCVRWVGKRFLFILFFISFCVATLSSRVRGGI